MQTSVKTKEAIHQASQVIGEKELFNFYMTAYTLRDYFKGENQKFMHVVLPAISAHPSTEVLDFIHNLSK